AAGHDVSEHDVSEHDTAGHRHRRRSDRRDPPLAR
ncbi:MAG: hypothetical protein AVDCRST_MAG71-586, partial [uncultured Lysobacter sp.]